MHTSQSQWYNVFVYNFRGAHFVAVCKWKGSWVKYDGMRLPVIEPFDKDDNSENGSPSWAIYVHTSR